MNNKTLCKIYFTFNKINHTFEVLFYKTLKKQKIMKARFLFPHYLKRIGIVVVIPFIVLGFMSMYNDFSFEFLFLDYQWFRKTQSDHTGNNLTNELAIIGVIIGLTLVAFSKEKFEDEYVSTLRLESLQWSMYLHFGLLILFTVLIYGSGFYTVMIYNMFTPLIIFILRFNYLLYIKPKFTQEKYD
jgi:hypothetical protein